MSFSNANPYRVSVILSETKDLAKSLASPSVRCFADAQHDKLKN